MRQAIATSKEGTRDPRGVFAPLLGERAPLPARQLVRYRVGPMVLSPDLACPIRAPKVFRPLGRDAIMDLDIEAVLVPGLAIWSVRSDSGFESIPDNMPEVFSIRIPLRRGVLSQTSSSEHETLIGSATILPVLDCLGSRFAPGSHVLSCAVGVADLVQRYKTLEGSDAPPLRLRPTVVIEGPRLQALVHTIRRIGDHIGTETEAMMSPLLVDLLLNQILSAWPMDQIDRMEEGPPSVIRLAIDFIEEHLGGALTVGDVATACGVSLRTLQALFRTRIGTTPLGYILERRLERAHADLLANDGRLQVSQIAHRWGFLHMGEFARRYRMRYGCTPSQTNRRGG